MKYKIYLKEKDFYQSEKTKYWDNKQYDLLPLICEVDLNTDDNINLLINYKGFYFSICCHTVVEPYVALAEHVDIISFKEKESNYNDEPTCPICGTEQSDAYEFDNVDEHICDGCGALLKIYRDIEVTYNTEVIKKPRIKKVIDNHE